MIWTPIATKHPPAYTPLWFCDDWAAWIGEWYRAEGYMTHIQDPFARLTATHWAVIEVPDLPMASPSGMPVAGRERKRRMVPRGEMHA